MISRRDFIRQLLMTTAAAELLDIDKLLWTPKSMITVPVRIYPGQFDTVLVELSRSYASPRYIAELVFPKMPMVLGQVVAVNYEGVMVPVTRPDQIPVGVVIGPGRGRESDA